MENVKEYKTVRQIASCGRYPFTMGQLRTFLLDRDKNGLSSAVRRIGKRIYIRTDLFENWIESKGEPLDFAT